jgi:hypothetical protein
MPRQILSPAETAAVQTNLVSQRAMLAELEQQIERSNQQRQRSASDLDRQFNALSLQLLICSYDISFSMSAVAHVRPSGLALRTALSGVVVRLFEFEKMIHKRWLPDAEDVLSKMSIHVPLEERREVARAHRGMLKRVREWRVLRNVSGGHYGAPDEQIRELETLQVSEVEAATDAFMLYLRALMEVIGNAIERR